MKRAIQLVSILLTISGIFSVDHRYCQLETCPNRTHTLCEYSRPDPAAKCGRSFFPGLIRNEIQRLTNMYNENVSTVVVSEEKEHPEASEDGNNTVTVQYTMEWDEELAEIAQRWANQCENSEDKCRHVDRFLVRQRVGMEMTSIYDPPPTIFPLVTTWIREERSARLDNVDFQSLSFDNIGDVLSKLFTDLMSQRVNKFGCGAIRSYDDLFQYLYLVCNYGPA